MKTHYSRKIIYLITVLLLSAPFYLKAYSADQQKKKFDRVHETDVKKIKKPPVASAVKKIRPDLTIKDPGLNPGCRVKFTIRNYSKSKLTDAEHRKGKVEIRVIGKPSKTYTLDFSAIDARGDLKKPGGEATHVSDIKIAGKSSIVIDVDPADRIDEANEKNNSTGQVRLNPTCIDLQAVRINAAQTRPDLVIDNMSVSPVSPDISDDITVRVRVRNQGEGVSGTCKLELRVGGEGSPSKHDIPRMARGASYSIQRVVRLPIAQTYRSRAKVDCDRQLVESDESNNEQIMDFTVISRPKSSSITNDSLKKDIRLPPSE